MTGEICGRKREGKEGQKENSGGRGGTKRRRERERERGREWREEKEREREREREIHFYMTKRYFIISWV